MVSRRKENKNKMCQVLFVPDWRLGNPYLELLERSVEKFGYRVSYSGFPSGLLKLSKLVRQNSGVGVIHLHWIGGLARDILWSSSALRFYMKLLLFTLDVYWCRFRGVRIVWTIHNLYQHESPHIERETVFRRWLFRAASRVILHSDPALERVIATYGVQKSSKVTVIPHGSYLSVYPPPVKQGSALAASLGVSAEDTVLLFFGYIRRYKGLETLVEQFMGTRESSLKLVIAGRIVDKDLGAWISARAARDERIIVRFGFVADELLTSYFCLSNLVILPFERTLSSGSVILAMSMGKALLLPSSARVLGVPGERGALYFNSDMELGTILGEICKSKLAELGAANYELAKGLDWEDIGRRTAQAYV